MLLCRVGEGGGMGEGLMTSMLLRLTLSVAFEGWGGAGMGEGLTTPC